MSSFRLFLCFVAYLAIGTIIAYAYTRLADDGPMVFIAVTLLSPSIVIAFYTNFKTGSELFRIHGIDCSILVAAYLWLPAIMNQLSIAALKDGHEILSRILYEQRHESMFCVFIAGLIILTIRNERGRHHGNNPERIMPSH